MLYIFRRRSGSGAAVVAAPCVIVLRHGQNIAQKETQCNDSKVAWIRNRKPHTNLDSTHLLALEWAEGPTVLD